MARAFWLCQLVENPVGSNMWEPAILKTVTAVGQGMPQMQWSPTDAMRQVKYAVGVANLTDEQLAAIQADNNIQVASEVEWFTQFQTLSSGRRTRIRNLLTQIGLALPANNEVLRDLFSRINQAVDNKLIDDNLNRLS